MVSLSGERETVESESAIPEGDNVGVLALSEALLRCGMASAATYAFQGRCLNGWYSLQTEWTVSFLGNEYA